MSVGRLVIVSDAHLGAVPAAVEQGFLRFLDAVPDLGDGLLINGDLFDFWYAWRRVIPRAGIRVVSRLAALAERMPVALAGGNHDRWGGSFWHDELGIRYSPGELRLDFGGRSALAVHGDGVAEEKKRSVLLHHITRHPVTDAVFSVIHPDFGIWLVDRLSNHLADSTRHPEVLDRAATRQRAWAEARLRSDAGLALLVMGHTHRATAVELLPGQWYLNPGAWFEGARYAVATPESVELRQFPD